MKLEDLTQLGLAEETATALLESIEAEAQQRLEQERQAMPRVLAATPGDHRQARLREQFPSMDYGQRLRLKQQDPVFYAQLAEEQ